MLQAGGHPVRNALRLRFPKSHWLRFAAFCFSTWPALSCPSSVQVREKAFSTLVKMKHFPKSSSDNHHNIKCLFVKIL